MWSVDYREETGNQKSRHFTLIVDKRNVSKTELISTTLIPPIPGPYIFHALFIMKGRGPTVVDDKRRGVGDLEILKST